METFILLSFWVLVFGFTIRVFITAFSAYPRKSEYTLGLDIAAMVIKVPFILWCAYLLWA